MQWCRKDYGKLYYFARNTSLQGICECRQYCRGLSPFSPESVAMEAGRLMLQRIDQLTKEKVNFAFETTLAARSYVSLVKEARTAGYDITLLYFWLSSPRLAKERVAKRVSMGGHNISPYIIERRYYAGLRNLVKLYIPVCDN
jgi:predicted ABC-type ATPase